MSTRPDESTGSQILRVASGQPARLEVLDSVRGIAAFIVVIHHCLLTFPAFSDYFFSGWRTQAANFFETVMFNSPARLAWSGYEAVTLFFVLSGLVLALPWAEHRSPRYSAFMIKRICRIYVPYLAVITACCLLATLFSRSMDVSGYSTWLRRWNWSVPLTWQALLDAVVMGGKFNFLNGATHSLLWEMKVSLIFPVLGLVIARWRAKGAAGALLVLLALFLAGHSATRGSDQQGTVAEAIELTAFNAIFFVEGALIAFNLRHIRAWLTRRTGPQRLLILLTGIGIMITHWTHMQLVQAQIVGIGSSLVIIASLSPGSIESVLKVGMLRKLGAISYALYLVHIPTLFVLVALLNRILPHVVIVFLMPPVALLIAMAFDRYVVGPSALFGQRVAGHWRETKPAA